MWEYIEVIGSLTVTALTITGLALTKLVPQKHLEKKHKWKLVPFIVLDPELAHLRKTLYKAMQFMSSIGIEYGSVQISKNPKIPGCIYISPPKIGDSEFNSKKSYTYLKTIRDTIYMSHIHLREIDLNESELTKAILAELVFSEGYIKSIDQPGHILSVTKKGFDLTGIKR